jgi:hypothetical protein
MPLCCQCPNDMPPLPPHRCATTAAPKMCCCKCPDIAVPAALPPPRRHPPYNAAAAKALPFFVCDGGAGGGKLVLPGLSPSIAKHSVQSRILPLLVYLRVVKEYSQVEGVSAGFRVDLELASDLSHGIGVSETAECWEKVLRTSARPHIDLVPGGNGTDTRLMHADT